MKNLAEFYEAYIKEASESHEFKKLDGKDAEDNGTKGQVGLNEPTDNKASNVSLNKEDLNKNMKRLLMRFKTEKDFFIVGQAGWGKTSIIKSMADKFGYEILTVYLDKCVATDLGGTPVPIEGKDKKPKIEHALPKFAQVLYDNPKKKFLLFFDEMNQAAPDVQNALMPIVLEHEIAGVKFDNFFVGSAGNYEHENDAVSQLSKPLMSRLKPLIEWETDWTHAFKHLHQVWDDKLGKDFVNLFEDNADLFVNPREVDQKLFDELYKLKKAGDNDWMDPEDVLDYMEGLTAEDLTRNQKNQLNELADKAYEMIVAKEDAKSKGTGRSGSRKDINMIDKKTMEAIKHGMKYGYVPQTENGKSVKYGISRENISVCVDPDEVNAEMLERIIDKLETDGIKFKFDKDEEWKKAGYKDPMAD